MKFEEAELVMTNDGDFYRAFLAMRSSAQRHDIVLRYFRKLFPQELATERKIQMLRIHYEKEWLSEEKQKYPSRSAAIAASIEKRVNVDDDKPQSFVMKVETCNFISGFGETMSTPKLMETIHYVNGVDVRKLSDEQLINIIREREAQIAQLNSTKQVPARLKKKAAELQVELDALVSFLDNLDNPSTT